MKIVIEISEEVYKDIQKYRTIFDEDRDDIAEQILNGTLLPKGHGRLIDESKITKCEQIGLVIKDDKVARCLMINAPTIIEADKEDK